MNILKPYLLATQIKHGCKLLLYIDARSIIASTVMIKNYTVSGVPGSGRSGNKEPMKKTGKPIEKFGATSEESYFYGKQKIQLEKLKKELKRKMSGKDDKSEQFNKKRKKMILTKKKKTLKNILAGLLASKKQPKN